jgi:hypothetical protein
LKKKKVKEKTISMTAAARGSGVQDAKKNIRKKNQILVRITLVFLNIHSIQE